MLPKFDQMSSNDLKNSPLSYQVNNTGVFNMKESPSPITDDEHSAACTNLTQDFKIKMNRVAMGATNDSNTDQNL